MSVNETEYNYPITIEFSHFDPQGYLTPKGYQHIANSIADKHLIRHGLSFETLIQKGISWVLLSLSIEIQHPIQERAQTLFGKTWFSGRKGIYFRREISVHREDGTMVFCCALYSTLLDLNTRTIYRKRTLPFELMEPTEKILLPATPSFKEKQSFVKGEQQTVKRSYLDMLGHVNNERYGDFCFDALSESEADLKTLHRMELYFVSELNLQDSFSVNKAVQDKRVFVQGLCEPEEKPSFYGVFDYLPSL